MTTSLTTSLFEQINPLRLAGPLFDKELRVSSRRRRFYVLRCAYVCLLLLATVNLWAIFVRIPSTGSTLVQVSRMAEAGKVGITMIVWFQFITAQLIAAVLLSDAIGGEIRQRTLDALLVTPIGSVQIVLGKLLSKLLQLVLLLASSLPLLAIVRVFGGVPWAFVLLGLCVTLTTAVFVGSLSLFLSVRGAQFQRVTSSVVAWCLLLWFGGGALLLALREAGYLSHGKVASVLFLTNPFVLMVAQTKAMLSASAMGPGNLAWPLHCAVALAATAVILLLAIWRVRKITIMSIVAQVEGCRPGTKGRASGRSVSGIWPWRRASKPITGSPIVWKELHRPWFRHGRRSIIYGSIAVVVIVGAFISLAWSGASPHILFYLPIHGLQLAFIVGLAAGAASAITREKEARTWPILLATPLTEREIVRGKAFGLLRRGLWLLAPVPLLYLFFGLSAPSGGTNPLSVLVSAGAIIVGLTGAVLFLLGLGLYLSVRLKTTAAAVAATFGIYFGSKLLCCGGFSPLFLLSSRAMGPGGPSGMLAVFMPLLMTVGPAIIHAGAGLLFFRLATGRMRRDIFV